MPPIEACLLDYGNTVVEFDQSQIDRIREGAAQVLRSKVDPTLTMERVSEGLETVCTLPFQGDPPEYRELTPHEQMRLLLGFVYGAGRTFPEELVRECDDALQDLFVDAIRVDDSTIQFLERLKRRMPVGLVSNYPCGKTIRRSLVETGLDDLLDPVVVSGDIGFVKPHETVFRAALDQLDVPPESVLFVGDRWDADMVGARDVGMITCHHVGFTSDRDLDDRYSVYRPDYQVRRIEELETILAGGSPLSAAEQRSDHGG